jgi:hypothetical protein
MTTNNYQAQRQRARLREDLDLTRDVLSKHIVELAEMVSALATIVALNVDNGTLTLPEVVEDEQA